MIPAALRRRCGLRAGDHVLLAASPGQDTLAAYSFAVVDQALRAHAPVRRRREAAMTAVNPEPPSRLSWRRHWCCWSGWACPRRT